MWRLKINLILKGRFLCIRRYLIVVIFLNWFFSFKLFFIVVKGTVKFNIYRRFINLFKKIEMVMHHVSFFLCAILLIYTMGHKTRNWKTNLESGYLRWTCIFSLTFMTTLHLQSRYIARIRFWFTLKWISTTNPDKQKLFLSIMNRAYLLLCSAPLLISTINPKVHIYRRCITYCLF